VPSNVIDEEGGTGSRSDGRDLRAEFQAAGYAYVWNSAQLANVTPRNLPLLGLFERSHMEYEYDRQTTRAASPA
jgi:alkaline phosphatase